MLRKALDEYHVVGVSTNVEFLRTLAKGHAKIKSSTRGPFIWIRSHRPSPPPLPSKKGNESHANFGSLSTRYKFHPSETPPVICVEILFQV